MPDHQNGLFFSSLYWTISLILFVFVQRSIYVLDMKKQKVRANNYSLSALKMYVSRKYTPLYKKGIKQNQSKPIETTLTNFFNKAEI